MTFMVIVFMRMNLMIVVKTILMKMMVIGTMMMMIVKMMKILCAFQQSRSLQGLLLFFLTMKSMFVFRRTRVMMTSVSLLSDTFSCLLWPTVNTQRPFTFALCDPVPGIMSSSHVSATRNNENFSTLTSPHNTAFCLCPDLWGCPVGGAVQHEQPSALPPPHPHHALPRGPVAGCLSGLVCNGTHWA